MIILGIDPGVATIGFGAIRAERGKNTLLRYGVVTTPPGIPLSSRLLQISNDMEELIHTFHPDEMAVEELFFTKNITTGKMPAIRACVLTNDAGVIGAAALANSI